METAQTLSGAALAADLLLGLGERPVRDDHVPAAHLDRGRHRRRSQPHAVHESISHLLRECVECRSLLSLRANDSFVPPNQQCVSYGPSWGDDLILRRMSEV